MFMLSNEDDKYSLYPPNQLDWFYTLSKISETKWNVKGYKDDIFDLAGPQEVDYNYVLVDGHWCMEGSTFT
jgi:hypothetical protein